MLFVVTLWQKNGRKVNTYLDRQAVSLKIDTMVSTHWYPSEIPPLDRIEIWEMHVGERAHKKPLNAFKSAGRSCV
jgi:hypothetical protein